MSPMDWATRPLKKYASFSGRAPRAEYWWFYLLALVIMLASTVLERMFGFVPSPEQPYGMISAIVSLALLIPFVAVTVCRLHDTGRTGWWILVPAIPALIGVILIVPAMMAGNMGAALGFGWIMLMIAALLEIVLLVFMLLPGNKGDNRYGADPYGGAAGEPSA